MTAYDILAALEAYNLPKGVRWINHCFDGEAVIATLAYGVEEPAYETVVCKDESQAGRTVNEALRKLGALV